MLKQKYLKKAQKEEEVRKEVKSEVKTIEMCDGNRKQKSNKEEK